MASDDDFQKQLELEALEKAKLEQSEAGSSDPYVYVDPNDGTTYDWDVEKKAWFPRVDDNFIAKYQDASYNYQMTEEETKEAAAKAEQLAAPAKGEKRKATEPSWFQVDDDHNTNVYVSGLPDDITDEEFVELMGKCGLVMKDPESQQYKAKLYRNPDGTLKGDGRCCYIKIESVKLALDIIDGYLYKGKHKIHVERAQFQLKGEYDPKKKPKKKKGAKDKEKLKKKLDKLFDWRPDKLRGQRSRNENTVIIKNMFDPKEFEEDASLLLDYQKDIREECTKCGEVKKVVIYDRNPEGVVQVTFSEPEMADECINLMNGRWFASRQLQAEAWDGKTKYKIIETEEEMEKRLKSWDEYLEKGENQGTTSEKVPGKSTTANQVSGNENQGPVAVDDGKLAVSGSAYIAAGETDSSGDSDTESKLDS